MKKGPADQQTGEAVSAGNDIDRGHLVHRASAVWGETRTEAARANADTFHYTNAAPQAAKFNQGMELWLGLESPRACLVDLLDWTRRHFPGAEATHTWPVGTTRPPTSCRSSGRCPRGGGKILFATGYNKWGMSNSIAASLAITAKVLSGNLPWANTIHHRLTSPEKPGPATPDRVRQTAAAQAFASRFPGAPAV